MYSPAAVASRRRRVLGRRAVHEIEREMMRWKSTSGRRHTLKCGLSALLVPTRSNLMEHNSGCLVCKRNVKQENGSGGGHDVEVACSYHTREC